MPDRPEVDADQRRAIEAFRCVSGSAHAPERPSTRLAASAPNWGVAGGGYVVIHQLPERDGAFEYRIKSISQPHERVARESELVRE